MHRQTSPQQQREIEERLRILRQSPQPVDQITAILLDLKIGGTALLFEGVAREKAKAILRLDLSAIK